MKWVGRKKKKSSEVKRIQRPKKLDCSRRTHRAVWVAGDSSALLDAATLARRLLAIWVLRASHGTPDRRYLPTAQVLSASRRGCVKSESAPDGPWLFDSIGLDWAGESEMWERAVGVGRDHTLRWPR